MGENKKNRIAINVGVSIEGLVTLVFIILKLCKVITWSWKWVFAPIWIVDVIAFVIMVVAAIVYSVQD